MLVHGVDISMLEGWMIKINSNPHFFTKNTSRRWFKVAFVSGSGSDQKLVISYSTSKKAKDPRGWLYVEDVTGIYCRKEMIEIVSPSRTLRLKGETAVEHRLWSDSLYKLCNPPAESSLDIPHETKQVDRQQDDQRNHHGQAECERFSHADAREYKERSFRHDSDCEDKDLGYRNRARSRDGEASDHETSSRGSPSSIPCESKVDDQESRESFESSRAESEEDLPRNEESVSLLEDEESESDSSDETRDTSRPSTTRSLLVAQIKAGSTLEAPSKNIMSDSEEEDELQKKESPREPGTSSTNPIDDDENGGQDDGESLVQSFQLNLSSDLNELKRSRSTASNNNTTLVANVAADNNLDHDDWDAEGDDVISMTKTSYSTAVGAPGVAPDANFVHEDWDA